MNTNTSNRGESLLLKHKKWKRWQKIVSVMACLVVFITTYALILPAITMEKATYCDVEEHTKHSREAGCYTETTELICEKQESEGHTHSNSCYEISRVLICGEEESDGHTHGDSCYNEDGKLICDKEESDGHTHSNACYQEEKTLICDKEESDGHTHGDSCYQTSEQLICKTDLHEHSLACYSNPKADLESAADWEKSLSNVDLSSNCGEDLAAIAETQLNYKESQDNYVVEDKDTIKGYTRYGAWYGDNHEYADWDAMFVSFCLHYADIPESNVPQSADSGKWISKLKDKEIFKNASSYEPQVGDLIFLEEKNGKKEETVGIITEITTDSDGKVTEIKAIQGDISTDSGDKVQYQTYSSASSEIMGYGAMPVKPEMEDGETTEITAKEEVPEEVTTEVVAKEEIPEEATTEVVAKEEVPEEATTEVVEELINSVPYDGEYTAEAYLIPNIESNTISPAPKKAKARTSGVSPLAEGDTNNGTTTDKYDMSQYITTVNIQHRENDTDLWENITEGTVKVGDKLRFDISYELPADTLDAANRTIHYQVPDNITITKGETGTVKDGSGADVGDYVISSNGSITITFYEDYATKNAGGAKINGHIAFESSVDKVAKDEDGNITLPFKEEIKLEVKDPYGDIKVEKTSYDVDHFNGTMKYRIEVSSERGTGDEVVVQDTTANINIKSETVQVVDQNGDNVTVLNTNADGKTWTLPQFGAGGKYIITYDAELSSSAMQNLTEKNQNVTATNKAVTSSTDTEGQPIKWESSVQDTFDRNIIKKYGEIKPDEPNTIYWTIELNTVTAARTDLSGWRLSDDFNGNVLDPNKDVTIAPNPATGTGSITTHLPYTFPQGSAVTQYTVTYTTEGDENAVNNAVLTAPNGVTIGTGGITPGRADIKKTATGQDIIGKDENGNVLVEQNWHVDLSTSTVIRPDRVAYIAGIMSDDRNVFPNGGYWEILERLGDNKKMWFTPEQAAVTVANMAEALTDSGYVGNYYTFAYDPNKNVFRLINRSGGSDSYYNQATAWKNLSSADASDRYDRVFMVMDSAWGPNKALDFDVVSTLNAGVQRITVSVSNYATCHDGNFEISSGAIQSYSPILNKYDYRKRGTMSTAIMPTEYNFEDIGNTLQWGINVCLPDDINYSADVIITDTLPEGMTLTQKKESEKGPNYYSVWFKGANAGFGQNRDYPLIIDGILSQHGMSIKATDGSGSISATGIEGSINYSYGQYIETYQGMLPQEVKLTIPAELANKLKGKSITISVDGIITDMAFLEKSFTNTVNISYKGSELDQASQTQKVKQKVIAKGADRLTAEKTIPYYICFNTTGADLVPGSDTLELEDTLIYKSPDNSTLNLMLDHNSIQVYRIKGVKLDDIDITADMSAAATSTAIMKAPSDGDKAYAISEGLLMGELEEITSTCPYTYSETVDANGNYLNSFRMTVPDSERILVTYSYKASGSGKIDGLTNSASIKGQGGSSSSTESQIDITVQQSTADAVLVGINVYKVDSKNYAVHLNGAEFKLEKWNGSDWQQEQTFVTDQDKGFFNTGELEDNTAYRLTETKAPAGYEMKTPSIYEFYIRNTAMNAHAECKPAGFAGRALNNGDDITIANDKLEYELPHTGGIGITHLYIIGSLLLLIAGGWFLCTKRKEII